MDLIYCPHIARMSRDRVTFSHCINTRTPTHTETHTRVTTCDEFDALSCDRGPDVLTTRTQIITEVRFSQSV